MTSLQESSSVCVQWKATHLIHSSGVLEPYLRQLCDAEHLSRSRARAMSESSLVPHKHKTMIKPKAPSAFKEEGMGDLRSQRGRETHLCSSFRMWTLKVRGETWVRSTSTGSASKVGTQRLNSASQFCSVLTYLKYI